MGRNGKIREFGERLKKERLSLGMTQQQLSDRLGVTKTTLGRYERGIRSPEIELVIEMEEIGIDTFYLQTGGRLDSKGERVRIYETPNDALIVVVDIQKELKLSFSYDQIQLLLEYAYSNQAKKQQVLDFVKAAYVISGQPLKLKNGEDG